MSRHNGFIGFLVIDFKDNSNPNQGEVMAVFLGVQEALQTAYHRRGFSNRHYMSFNAALANLILDNRRNNQRY